MESNDSLCSKESVLEVCIDVEKQTKICIAQNMSMKKRIETTNCTL